MNQSLLLLGTIVIIIGVVIIALAFFTLKGAKVETRGAFVGFIGPIPFGVATDKQILYVAIALSAILFVAYFIYWFLLRKPF